MINKIFGSIIAIISLIAFCYSIFLFTSQGNIEIAFSLLAGGFFGIIVGAVVFRHGIRGAFEAYRNGTPDGFK